MGSVSAVAAFPGLPAFEPLVFIQRIVLPVGISFFVFQSLSYCIDLYQDHAPPAKSPGHSACFVVISLGLMFAQGYRPFLHFQC